ncbi:uncharacterized protein ACRADG_006721 isoform 2-T2 [Cochliomyia hominivorax]
MKFLLIINIILGLICLNRAAEMSGFFKDPKHPGKCVVDGIIMSPGEEVLNPKGECSRVFCGEESYAVIQTCGVFVPPKGYKLGEPIEPNAPYPKCCKSHFIPIVEGKVV